MKFKHTLLILSGILTAGSLVGCGGSSGGGNGTIKITFDHTFGESIEKAVIARFNTFKKLVEEEEGVKLSLEMKSVGSYKAVVNTVGMELEGGNGPTMTIAYPDHVAALQAKESFPGQYIVNMDSYMDDENIGFGKEAYFGDVAAYGKDDIIQSYLEEGQQFSRTGTFCLPYLKSTEILQYNVPKVKTALQYYPKTAELTDKEKTDFLNSMSFEELMEIAQVIVDHKEDLHLPDLTYPVFYDSDSNMVITQMIQSGLIYSDFDANGKARLGFDASVAEFADNITEATKLLQNIRDWHADGLLNTKTGNSGDYSSSSFKNEECVFVIGSTGGAGYSVPEEGSFDAAYARVPYVGEDSKTPLYVSQGPSIAFCNDKSVSKEINANRLKYAWKFYKYLILPKNNIAIACNNSMGYVPIRSSAYRTNDWSKVINPDDEEDITYYTYTARVIGDVIDGHYFSTKVFNGSDKYREYTTGIVTNLINTSTSIEKILADAVRETKNYMDKQEVFT